MNKKIYNYIVLSCSLLIIFSIVLLFVINSQNKVKNSFIFNEHLNDTFITMDNEDTSYSISLKELSYYVLVMEASVNNTASLYDPSNTNKFWNLYLENTFVSTIAKDTSIDMCIRDNIYYNEAIASDFDLDETELLQVSDEASNIYYNLTGKQVDATELTLNDIYNIRYKIILATKYITHLMKNNEFTEKELNINGSYYESLYKKYNVDIDDNWDEISLGNITIDN